MPAYYLSYFSFVPLQPKSRRHITGSSPAQPMSSPCHVLLFLDYPASELANHSARLPEKRRLSHSPEAASVAKCLLP